MNTICIVQEKGLIGVYDPNCSLGIRTTIIIKGTMCQLVNGKVKQLINIEICSSTG